MSRGGPDFRHGARYPGSMLDSRVQESGPVRPRSSVLSVLPHEVCPMHRRPLVVLALSTAFLAVGACSKQEGGGQGGPGGGMPPPEVGDVVMQQGNVPISKEGVGRLSAYRSADVRPRVPG